MFRMCKYMHKIILIKEYFNNKFYFIYYITGSDTLFDAMVNDRAWFTSVL